MLYWYKSTDTDANSALQVLSFQQAALAPDLLQVSSSEACSKASSNDAVLSALRSPPTSCRCCGSAKDVVKLVVKLVVKVLSFQQAALAPDLLQVLWLC